VIADHTREVSERCHKPFLLENITSHIRLTGDLAETDFFEPAVLKVDVADALRYLVLTQRKLRGL